MNVIVNRTDYIWLEEFLERCSRLCDKAHESLLEWKDVYDSVFSKNEMKRLYEILPDFDWYDPDTTYQEDTVAFITQFSEYFKIIQGL